MKKYKLIIVLLFLISNINAQMTKRLSDIDNYSFASLYFISGTKAFITNYLNISVNEPTPLDRLDELGNINKDNLLKELNFVLKKFPNDDSEAIIDSVLAWDKMATLIDFPFFLENTNLSEFHELISQIESTEQLVNRHIQYEGQYWGSLSSSQTTEVYYKMMEYLLHLNSENRLQFFKLYFELAYEIGKN
jgi:hypothetical protein